MKLFIQKIKDVKLIDYSLLLAILLNIVYLVGMLLIYKPFLSPDDYLMSETVYGVFGDDYDYHAKYMNFNYGRIIVFLLRLFPHVPWYTILFYIWVFFSLVIVSKIVLDKFPKNISLAIVNVILLYFSYEGYICIQFTKIAGITGAVGATAILLGTSWIEFLIGMVLFIISIMIRYDMAKMVVGSFFAMLIFMLCIELVSKGKVKWDKKIYLRMGIVAIFFFIVPKIPSYDASEKLYWDYYWECNSNRSFIQDYPLPDYETYKDIYDKLDISQNDLYLWQSWNCDGQAMTSERIDVLRNINSGMITSKNQLEKDEYIDQDIWEAYQRYINELETKHSDGYENTVSFGIGGHNLESLYKKLMVYLNSDSLIGFFKKFPKVFLTIDVAFAYLMCVFLSLIISHRERIFSFLGALVSFLIGLVLNYYLYVNGRYLQHRVDVGIFCTLICIFIVLYKYNSDIEEEKEKIHVIHLSIILMLLSLITPYEYFWDDRYSYSDQQVVQNQELVKYMMETENISFLIAGTKEGGTKWYRYRDAFTVPLKGSQKNLFSSYWFGECERYEEYGIKYIYSDMIDNDSIYLVLADEDKNEGAWEEYISKHSGKETHLELQYCMYGAKFYQAKTERMSIDE